MKFLSCRAGIDWKIKMNVWSGVSVIRSLLHVGLGVF